MYIILIAVQKKRQYFLQKVVYSSQRFSYNDEEIDL